MKTRFPLVATLLLLSAPLAPGVTPTPTPAPTATPTPELTRTITTRRDGSINRPAGSLPLTDPALGGALPITRGGTGASSAGDARTALGIGAAGTASVGTSAGTVAAGDDSRFKAVGTTAGTVAAGNDVRIGTVYDAASSAPLISAVGGNPTVAAGKTLGNGAWSISPSGGVSGLAIAVNPSQLEGLSMHFGGFGSSSASTGAVTLSFNLTTSPVQSYLMSSSAGTTFATDANMPGACLVARLIGGSSTQNLTFPSGWKFVATGGYVARPASLAAGKTALLELTCFGTTDADIVAKYWVEY